MHNSNVIARFVAKVAVSTTLFYAGSPCMLWTAYSYTGRLGSAHCRYGHFWVGPYKTCSSLSHRFIYSLYHGVVPATHDVDHLCRRTLCQNVEHLDAVLSGKNRANTSRRK